MGWFKRKKRETKPCIIWHVPEGRDDLIPRRATNCAMAYDLVSPVEVTIPKYDLKLGVGSALINTLLVVTTSANYGIVLRSRSGLASKGLTVEAGEIDTGDYRGLLKVLLFNHRGESYTIKAGDRIAQARIVKIYHLENNVSYEYPDPDETDRGTGGFGSTGK